MSAVLAMAWEAWGVIVVIIAMAVLGVLYALSSLLRDFHRSLALKQEIDQLHQEHAARLADLELQEQLNAQVELGG